MPVLSINSAAMRDTKSWVTVSEKTRGDEISIYLQYRYPTSNVASRMLNPLFDGIKITINISWRILIENLGNWIAIYARLYFPFYNKTDELIVIFLEISGIV